METQIADIGPGGTLLSVEHVLRSRRQAEFDDLRLAAQWADFHGDDPKEWPASKQVRGMARLTRVGGAGTPEVQDLCVHELAISRQAHPMSTRWLMADALDLIHRLPRCWAVVEALKCEAWVARKVAKATRDLSEDEAAYVDAAVVVALAGEQPGVVLDVLEAKVIEANPGLHERKVREERERRFVSLGRMNEAGLSHVIARVEHGDAVWVDALVDRIADILGVQDKAAELPFRSQDTRRSVAFGWLARPAELLALLLEHADEPDHGPAEHEDEDETNGTGDGEGEPGPGFDDPVGSGSRPDAGVADDPEPGPEPEDEPESVSWADSWSAGFPEHLLDALKSMDPAKLRPQAVVYVHLHQAALASSHPTGRGSVAKVENGGPVLPKHLGSMLGQALVKVTEVVDLNGMTPVATYVHPQWLKDQVQLISPRTAFPHSTTISRAVDYDHVEPFKHAGEGAEAPPGQTGVHNSAPLGRSQHRAKTHAGYTVRIAKPGTTVWRTPHQRYRLVDPTGTKVIDERLGHALFGESRVERGFALILAEHEHEHEPEPEPEQHPARQPERLTLGHPVHLIYEPEAC